LATIARPADEIGAARKIVRNTRISSQNREMFRIFVTVGKVQCQRPSKLAELYDLLRQIVAFP
jgi:hypothetical protein